MADLYEFLTPEEKARIDKFRARYGLTRNRFDALVVEVADRLGLDRNVVGRKIVGNEVPPGMPTT